MSTITKSQGLKYVPKILIKSSPSNSVKPKGFINKNKVANKIDGNLPIPKPLQSVLVKRDSNSKSNEVKVKKRVTFAPDTVNHCRELKPYKYHNIFKPAKRDEMLPPEYPGLRFIEPPGVTPVSSPDLNNNTKLTHLLSSQLTAASPPGSLPNSPKCVNIPSGFSASSTRQLKNYRRRQQQLLQFHQEQEQLEPGVRVFEKSEEPEPDEEFVHDNEYIAFTHARKTFDYMSKRAGPSACRAKRLFQLIDELSRAHINYNLLKTTESRDHFLLDEILVRHIMGLDLALTENYTGFAMEFTHAMADITQYMLPLYASFFYNADGSRTELPIVTGQDDSNEYLHTIAPVAACLNQISESRPRNDNSNLNLETLLTKLQLEMITLIICPIRSVMFRSVLEIVANTAIMCYDALLVRIKVGESSEGDEDQEETSRNGRADEDDGYYGDDDKVKKKRCDGINQDENSIRWVNNSTLYKDYVSILRSIGLADKIGCLSHVPTISMDVCSASNSNNGSNIYLASTDDGNENVNVFDRVNSALRAFSPMNMHSTDLN